MAANPNPLHGLDPAQLQPMVREALRAPDAEVESWQGQRPKVFSGDPATRGIFRVWGVARIKGAPQPWSMVLKIIHSPADLRRVRGVESGTSPREDPTHATFWRREAEIYESGWLADLPGGLRAPRCFAIDTTGDDEIRLWLEDVPDELPGAWPLERFAEVARELGRFNGICLVQRPLASARWRVRGWLRSWVEGRRHYIQLIADPRAWEHPLLSGCFGETTRARILALWEDREAWLEALDRLPHTPCHLDAVPNNLHTRIRADGGRDTVAVDWGRLSLAPLGAEAQALSSGAGATHRAGIHSLESLDAVVSAGYRRGLEDAGVRPDPRTLRFAFAATASLQRTFGTAGLLLRSVAEHVPHPDATPDHARRIQAYIADRTRLIGHLLELGEEARALFPG